MGPQRWRHSRGAVLAVSSLFVLGVVAITLFVRGGSSAQTADANDSFAIGAPISSTPTTVPEEVRQDELLQSIAADTSEAESRFDTVVKPNIPAGQECSDQLFNATTETNSILSELKPELAQGAQLEPLQAEVNKLFSTVEVAVESLETAPQTVAKHAAEVQKQVDKGDLAGAQAAVASLNNRVDALADYLENCPSLVAHANDVNTLASKVYFAQKGTTPPHSTTTTTTTTIKPNASSTTTVKPGTATTTTTKPAVTTTTKPKVTTTTQKPKATTTAPTTAKPVVTTTPTTTLPPATTTIKPATTTLPPATTTTVKPTTTAAPTTTLAPTTTAPPTTAAPTTTAPPITSPPP